MTPSKGDSDEAHGTQPATSPSSPLPVSPCDEHTGSHPTKDVSTQTERTRDASGEVGRSKTPDQGKGKAEQGANENDPSPQSSDSSSSGSWASLELSRLCAAVIQGISSRNASLEEAMEQAGRLQYFLAHHNDFEVNRSGQEERRVDFARRKGLIDRGIKAWEEGDVSTAKALIGEAVRQLNLAGYRVTYLLPDSPDRPEFELALRPMRSERGDGGEGG
ncbi:hypothetical protein C1H76_2544 [Elsinoe australis]|uniref:Uncharacterized protein n=1 Tax=Elsinoe australis TaxID=40998 RepID=A0A4U7B6S4_9PEZI|nr:hypothetical protein C1H76_2544 [Elsinoe australis]